MIKKIQLRGISRTPSDREEWRDMPGFEGKYSVSSIGRVRSNIAYNGRGKILQPHLRNNYLEINLFDANNSRNSHRVHRLVAETFIGRIPDKMQVNHINGNKQDNRASNLEIVTASENSIHAFHLGLSKPNDNGLKKTVTAMKNGAVVGTYPSIREMCRQMNLDRRSVMRTLNGTWKQYRGYTFTV